MNDEQSGNSHDDQGSNISACRARILGKSKLVECQTRVSTCQWQVTFGDGQLCGHPSNKEIAKGILLMGWSPSTHNAVQPSRPMP